MTEDYDYDEVFVIIWSMNGDGEEIIDNHFPSMLPESSMAEHDASMYYDAQCELMDRLNDLGMLEGLRFEVTWQKRMFDEDIEPSLVNEHMVEIKTPQTL